MNFVVIYGPTAAGKLSVAKELKHITGYKLLDSHSVLNPIAELFPFEDPELNEIRKRLGRKFRLELFEEAAKAGVDFITTLIIATPDSFAVMREAKTAVERYGGQTLFVQLLPSHEAIMERVESESRRGVKLASREGLEQFLIDNPMQFETFPDVEHLVIDNTHLEPQEVARQIASHYRLI